VNRSSPLHPAPRVIHTGTIHRILRAPSVPPDTAIDPRTSDQLTAGHRYILSDCRYSSYLPCRMCLRFSRHFPDDGGKAPRKAGPSTPGNQVASHFWLLQPDVLGQRLPRRRDRAAPAAGLAVIGQVADARWPGDAGSRRPDGVSSAPRPLGASPRSAGGFPGTAPAGTATSAIWKRR
jgi:hypothetical protein